MTYNKLLVAVHISEKSQKQTLILQEVIHANISRYGHHLVL